MSKFGPPHIMNYGLLECGVVNKFKNLVQSLSDMCLYHVCCLILS